MENETLKLELADDGYPTEETLQQIEAARVGSYADCIALLQAIRAIWQFADAGYWSQAGGIYMISTAGWSGNESIIEALMSNHMFWALCWETSRRGGHYTFSVNVDVSDGT
jgi:hypothetical protein